MEVNTETNVGYNFYIKDKKSKKQHKMYLYDNLYLITNK